MTNKIVFFVFASSLLVGNCLGKKPGPDHDQLKAMQWMIGEWEGSWEVQPGAILGDAYPVGAKVRSSSSYAWIQNKNYIRLKFHDEIGGEKVHEGLEMIGVDPKTKKMIHWLFSVVGGTGNGEWSRRGDTWLLKWDYTAGDGTTLEGVSYLIPIDENTHTWQIKGMKENGKDVPDTPLVKFQRVKRKDQ